MFQIINFNINLLVFSYIRLLSHNRGTRRCSWLSHCPTSHCTTSHCPTSHCTTSHCHTSHCTTSHCPTSHCPTSHCPTSHCPTGHCLTSHCTTSHCPTSHCTTSHCPTSHCPTSQKVAVPADVTGSFHWFNPFGSTMALELTQLLTEWIPGLFPGGLLWADNFTTFICLLSRNLVALKLLKPSGPVQGLLTFIT
jgi:hypothetical protein